MKTPSRGHPPSTCHPLSRPGLLSVLQFNMPSLLHDASSASSWVSRQTFPISRLYIISRGESNCSEEPNPPQLKRPYQGGFETNTHFSSAMLAPYELHPATTASTGEGREMADCIVWDTRQWRWPKELKHSHCKIFTFIKKLKNYIQHYQMSREMAPSGGVLLKSFCCVL